MVMKNLPIGFTAMYVRIRYASSYQQLLTIYGTLVTYGWIGLIKWLDDTIILIYYSDLSLIQKRVIVYNQSHNSTFDYYSDLLSLIQKRV